MTSIEEWYEHPSDEILTENHIADFQSAVAWPAMNNLCRLDFVNEARVADRDAFHMEKTFAGYYYELDMGFVDENDWEDAEDAELDADETVDEEGEGYIFANLAVSRRRDDLKEQLVETFKQFRIMQANANAKVENDQKKELEDGGLVRVGAAEEGPAVEEFPDLDAWETRRYHFSPLVEHGIGVDICYELADGPAVVWSTESPVEWDDLRRDEDEREVEEAFCASLTAVDLALIRKGFAALGVNPVFLEWYPAAPEGNT